MNRTLRNIFFKFLSDFFFFFEKLELILCLQRSYHFSRPSDLKFDLKIRLYNLENLTIDTSHAYDANHLSPSPLPPTNVLAPFRNISSKLLILQSNSSIEVALVMSAAKPNFKVHSH